MNDESQSLRNDIRTGLVVCQCRRISPMMETLDYHVDGCEWRRAIERIYEIERAEDARKK